jgi:hypothetical protein
MLSQAETAVQSVRQIATRQSLISLWAL